MGLISSAENIPYTLWLMMGCVRTTVGKVIFAFRVIGVDINPTFVDKSEGYASSWHHPDFVCLCWIWRGLRKYSPWLSVPSARTFQDFPAHLRSELNHASCQDTLRTSMGVAHRRTGYPMAYIMVAVRLNRQEFQRTPNPNWILIRTHPSHNHYSAPRCGESLFL